MTSVNATDILSTISPYNETGNQTATDNSDENFHFILYKVVIPFLFGLITVIGTIGNCLVIYVILSKIKMRTVTNLLLLNLAFADLLFLVICPPFTAFSLALEHWPFGDIACRLMHYMVNVTAYVTVYTLVLISIIRFLTVVYYGQTTKLRTKVNIVLMILGIWTVFLSLNIPVLLVYKQTDKSGRYDCDINPAPTGQRLFATFFTFAYVIPLAVIAVFSILILHHIRQSKSAMLGKNTKSSNRKKTASRLIIIVVVIFAIFWLPIHIHLLVAYFGSISTSKVYQVISVLWNVLAYFNSCVNPIIYNYASKDFRDSFREVVCCLRTRKFDLNGETGVETRLEPMTNGKDKEEKKLLAEFKDNNVEATNV